MCLGSLFLLSARIFSWQSCHTKSHVCNFFFISIPVFILNKLYLIKVNSPGQSSSIRNARREKIILSYQNGTYSINPFLPLFSFLLLYPHCQGKNLTVRFFFSVPFLLLFALPGTSLPVCSSFSETTLTYRAGFRHVRPCGPSTEKRKSVICLVVGKHRIKEKK